MQLRLLSVNVAQPSVIGERDGQPVRSAIAKKPVVRGQIAATSAGLAGDGVADPLHHGGVDKAVYAYTADHWDWWRTQHDMPCMPGTFGENLTVAGADETSIRIGDRFRWGEVLFEVSHPRSPCYKFQMITGREDAAALMTTSGTCGFYLRVLEAGSAATDAPLVRETEGTGASVRDAFLAAFNRRLGPELREKIAAHPALANAWRRMLLG